MDQDLNAPVVELNDYLAILKRRLGLIVGSAFIFALLGGVWSQLQETTYSATVEVKVEPILIDQIDTGASPAKFIDLTTEVETIRSPQVAAIAAEKMDIQERPSKLRKSIEVSPVEDSQILKIRCTRNRGRLAQECARKFAEAYRDFRSESAIRLIDSELNEWTKELEALEASDAEVAGDARGEGNAADAASEILKQNNQARIGVRQRISGLNALKGRDYVTFLDTDLNQPSAVAHGSSLPLNVLIGMVLGTLVGVGLAFLRDRTDDTLKDSGESLERMGLRVLSAIPRPSGGIVRKRNTGAIEEADSAISEAHRRLRSNVLFLANRDNTRVLLVTSPQAESGITTVTANLGVSLARAGKRVLVISAALRNSTMHELFRLPNHQGLSTVLENPQSANAVIQPALGMSHLGVMVAGPSVEQPAELLSRPTFPAIIRGQLDRFDLIIIEGPPVLAVSDALAVAPYTDGVLLTVDNEFTTRTDVRNAVEQLRAVGGNVIGSVLLNSKTSGSNGGGSLGAALPSAAALLRKPAASDNDTPPAPSAPAAADSGQWASPEDAAVNGNGHGTNHPAPDHQNGTTAGRAPGGIPIPPPPGAASGANVPHAGEGSSTQ